MEIKDKIITCPILNQMNTMKSGLHNSPQTPSSIMSDAASKVLATEVGNVGIITINRPNAMNSVNGDMIKRIMRVLKAWEGKKRVVLIRGNGKSFCGGGDMKMAALTLKRRHGNEVAKQFFREQYSVTHLIGQYKTTYIAIMNGVNMGGGLGLSLHAKHRIATESTIFAMPETAVGLFPYVGATYVLPRLRGKLGLYLAMTGQRLKGADVYHAGIATHYIPKGRFTGFTKAILKNKSTDPRKIESILYSFQPDVAEQFILEPHMYYINKYFSADTVEEILQRIKPDKSGWAQETYNVLTSLCPLSLKTTHKAFYLGATKSLDQCLKMEYRLLCHCLNTNSNFFEGIRAALIDKDQNPIWKQKSLSDVPIEMVLQNFEKTPEGDLEFVDNI